VPRVQIVMRAYYVRGKDKEPPFDLFFNNFSRKNKLANPNYLTQNNFKQNSKGELLL